MKKGEERAVKAQKQNKLIAVKTLFLHHHCIASNIFMLRELTIKVQVFVFKHRLVEKVKYLVSFPQPVAFFPSLFINTKIMSLFYQLWLSFVKQ